MEELRKKVKELKQTMISIRQTEYAIKRNRTMLENTLIDSLILEVDKKLKKILDKKKLQ